MTNAPRISTELLQACRACSGPVEQFAQEWPDGDVITEETIARAFDLGLDIVWLGEALFSGEALVAFRQEIAGASATYHAACAAAKSIYHEHREAGMSIEEARREHADAVGPTHRAYQQAAVEALFAVGAAYGWGE